MIDTYSTWAALGEAQRVIHRILMTAEKRTADGITDAELDQLDQIDQTLQQILSQEEVTA